jgi:hypothetical protein
MKEDSDDGDSHHHSLLTSDHNNENESSFKSEVQDMEEFNSSRYG